MGGLLSCPCAVSSRRKVFLVKEDGELLKLKEGTRVKDVLAANPYHKIIRCCSGRTVLPDSFQLSCNQLYFLLPQGLALSDETYDSLLRLVASRDSTFSARSSGDDGNVQKESKGVAVAASGRNLGSNDDSKHCNSRWKPTLKTIPEGNSPAVLSDTSV